LREPTVADLPGKDQQSGRTGGRLKGPENNGWVAMCQGEVAKPAEF